MELRGVFMKVQKNISIDYSVAQEMARKKSELNFSEICENALRFACEMEKPTKEKDIKARLLSIENERSNLLKLISAQEKQEKELKEKRNKTKFRENLIKLKEIKFKYPENFSKYRLEFEKEYNISTFELMKELQKI